MTPPLLIMDRVSRIHGSGDLTVHAVNRVSLEVRPGELVAVMGPSGCGKSTLLNLAGALDLPTSGRVMIDGEQTTALSPSALARVRRRTVGFVFQDFNLIPSLTALENVTLPLELDGTRARISRRLGRDALASVELSEHADRFPDELSGGQRQRVAIARSMVGDRKLVLADEPTGALDSATSDVVLQLLRDRCDAGAGGLLVTHEPRHAGWADRVIMMRDGTIVDTSAPDLDADRLLTWAG